MDNKHKFGGSMTAKAVETDDMEKINRLTLEPLEAAQVYTFSVNACDNQVDRDLEQFSDAALDKMAELFVGKTVIFDHRWSASGQTARVYNATVVQDGHIKRLRLDCYMLNNDATRPTIDAIKGGILREVSVGVSCGRSICSVCGSDYYTCGHFRGETYNGVPCTVTLDEVIDVYELSFVAVPAQREAGTTKAAGVAKIESDREIAAKKAANERDSARLSVAKAMQAQRKRKLNI